MEDPTTVALYLTFFGTLAVAFVMFLGLFIAFVLTLVFAGLGRGVTAVVMALAGLLGAKAAGAGTKPAEARRPAKKEPQLAAEWRAAVARADVRAMARTGPPSQPQARPEAGPEAPERKAG